jgi:hypothetical protein
MPDSFPLPELARSLRALGASRGEAGDAAHAAVFGPLLDARAMAATTDEEGALSALRGELLAARIRSRVDEAAQANAGDAASGRARASRARELLEPLTRSLVAMDAIAARARGKGGSSPEWGEWVAALRRAFALADDACRGIARLLEEPAATEQPKRWFGRPRR